MHSIDFYSGSKQIQGGGAIRNPKQIQVHV